MDSLGNQKVKSRKMKVAAKRSRVQILLDLFYRVIEITVVMVTVAKLCYQLVITFQGSGLAGFLVNRHLAFVLGNAIVIAIISKCGLFVNQEPDPRRNSNDFYEEFVRESSRGVRISQTDVICREKQSEAKQSMSENRAKQSSEERRQNRAKQSMSENRVIKQSTEDKREKLKNTENIGEEKEKKDITVKRHRQIITQKQDSPRQSYERSRSENHDGSKKSSSCGRFKRSETERSADGIDSDDELLYKIESFIARQRRNQKDEEFCII